MNQACAEQVIDARLLPPRQRHPKILDTWDALPRDAAMVLVNDHDPLPLYYQFSCEQQGHFHWEYLEQGPEVWRVRIIKGNFADPGFVPARKFTACCGPAAGPTAPIVLDTRPIFEHGETPCAAIDEAVTNLTPGQALVVLVPFEPVPLYAKLAREGFSHATQQSDDGTWRVEFRKG